MNSCLLSLPSEVRQLIWGHYLEATKTIDLPSTKEDSPVHFNMPWRHVLTTSRQVQQDLQAALARQGRFVVVRIDTLEILHVAADNNRLFERYVKTVDCRFADRFATANPEVAAANVANGFYELQRVLDEFEEDGSYVADGDASFGSVASHEYIAGREWSAVKMWAKIEF